MQATNWEFTNRALVFGLIFSASFPLYFFDHHNSVDSLASWIGSELRLNPNHIARLLFAAAAVFLIVAALIRTWASAYLHAGTVYAAGVKTDRLVADGPYRHVRNPLYFANILMVIAIGTMMSRLGFFLALLAMLVFSYRLILREEAALRGDQGEQYEEYRRVVPRFWPSILPRIAAAGHPVKWAEGFSAESWYWGLAVALVAFVVTLKLAVFFAILTASLVLFWASSIAHQRKIKAKA